MQCRVPNSALALVFAALCLIGFPSIGRAACTGPSHPEGYAFYNTTTLQFQYCEGTNWIAMNVPGSVATPAGCPNIGDVCDDGSVYAGLSPDGNVKMYTTPADAGASAWNNGNSSGYTATSQADTNAGEANTADLLKIDSDSGVAGMQPHLAVQECADLTANGHDDWYLPAKNELNVLYTNKAAIGGFDTSGSFPAGSYWSSSELSYNGTWSERFSDGLRSTHHKDYDLSVRCVRKAPGCSDPARPEGSISYNPDYRVMQGCAGSVWRAMGPIGGTASPCSGSYSFTSSSEGQTGDMYEYAVSADEIGCKFTFTVDGAGGGRGNHGGVTSNADGGDGGRVTFSFIPAVSGSIKMVIGEGGTGSVGAKTTDDPEPGAGGGGSSQVIFDPDTLPDASDQFYLAVAGGGGGGGWGEHGADGGGGNNECGAGSGGGCNGVTGTLNSGSDPGGSCPSDGVAPDPDPCGGPGGDGSAHAPDSVGGFGVGAGFGGDEVGSEGSGGGGGGYGGGASGAGAGGKGLGGGAYLDNSRTDFIGGSTGGADNGARYADGMALKGGDGKVEFIVTRGSCKTATMEVKPEGTLLYNSDAHVMQYCDGANWVAIGKVPSAPDPCAGSPSPGDVCADGTVYAGLSPDGDVKMYTTAADEGGFAWNNGNNSGFTTTSQTSFVTGETNTTNLLTIDSDSGVGSIQPHLAAQQCANSTANGHSDWYLPAKNELNVLYTNKTAIGGFNVTGSFPAGYYWSSSEHDSGVSWSQRFSDGNQNNLNKSSGMSVRCVRKD